MKRLRIYRAVFLLCAVSVSRAQTFEVISLDGSAKVQRVQKKELENLAIGSQLHDNDIVESYFQTKCVLRFGKGNIVIIGSNSKILVNIREKETSPGILTSDVNLTLFSGACFVKAISQAHIGVYTSNAVGETENGSFCTVVESKTGETGFQILGGNAKTRNIAQKEGINLASGQTTMIFPGKEPTAPLYITYKHVSVLKHFFGEDYITSELEAAGIKPTEDKSSRSSLLSQDQLFGRGNSQDLTTYKALFSLNKIYGAILADREKNRNFYVPIQKPQQSANNKLTLELRTSIAMTSLGVFPDIQVVPSYSTGPVNAGLRLSFASNYTGSIGMYGFSSGAGILDLIDHITWGKIDDPIYVKAGPLNNYTIGSGLVVNNFNNGNPFCLFQPLGFSFNASTGDLSAQGFIADLSQFSIGGVNVLYEPSRYHLGVGYFFDGDQYQAISPIENNRFTILPQVNSSTVKIDSTAGVNIYEVDAGMDVVCSEDLRVFLGVDFAQKFLSSRTDGFAAEIPTVIFDGDRMHFEAGIITESGRLIAGQFNSYYMSNRWRIDSTENGDTLVTQNSMLSSKRLCQGINLLFGISPYTGMALQVSLRQNFVENHSFDTSYVHDTTKLSPGTDLSLSLCVNDSLIKLVKYGEIYLRHDHTGIFPPRSTLFSSWGFSTGLTIITNPIIFGVSLNGDLGFSFLDMNKNNRIDAGDAVFKFSISLMRGVL
ncbi:MAG: hypothetical protein WBM07_13130 [Chitinivibrionales bacterium]